MNITARWVARWMAATLIGVLLILTGVLFSAGFNPIDNSFSITEGARITFETVLPGIFGLIAFVVVTAVIAIVTAAIKPMREAEYEPDDVYQAYPGETPNGNGRMLEIFFVIIQVAIPAIVVFIAGNTLLTIVIICLSAGASFAIASLLQKDDAKEEPDEEEPDEEMPIQTSLFSETDNNRPTGSVE